MSDLAELHLVKKQLERLEDVVEDDAAGAEYMDKIIGCANRWADRLAAARKRRS